VYFSELFDGLKQARRARLFTTLFFARRLVFCCLVTLLAQRSSFVCVGWTYLSVQVLHTAFVVGLKPFEQAKDNLCESVNETAYTAMCGLLVYLSDEQRWTQAYQDLFLSLIVTINTVY